MERLGGGTKGLCCLDFEFCLVVGGVLALALSEDETADKTFVDLRLCSTEIVQC
jgi:hypothetical protein